MMLAVIASGPVGADAIYKSVDTEGKVTYSAAPPPPGSARRVEEVRIEQGATAPPPQDAGTAKPPGPRPDPKQRSPAVQQAQKDLLRAQAEFGQTKIQEKTDWETGPTGEKIPSAAYTARVAAAQAKVEAADQALKRARRP